MRPVRNPDRLAAFLRAREAVVLAEASRSVGDVVAAWKAMAVLGVHPAQVWLIRRVYQAGAQLKGDDLHAWRDASRQLLTDILPLARRYSEGQMGDRLRRAISGPRPEPTA